MGILYIVFYIRASIWPARCTILNPKMPGDERPRREYNPQSARDTRPELVVAAARCVTFNYTWLRALCKIVFMEYIIYAKNAICPRSLCCVCISFLHISPHICYICKEFRALCWFVKRRLGARRCRVCRGGVFEMIIQNYLLHTQTPCIISHKYLKTKIT